MKLFFGVLVVLVVVALLGLGVVFYYMAQTIYGDDDV